MRGGFRLSTLALPVAIVLSASAEERPDRVHITLPGDVRMPFIRIPAGTFLMGSPPDEQWRFDSEDPQHEVSVPSFYLGRTEVTVAQYQAFVEATGHSLPDTSLPTDLRLEQRCPTWEEQLAHPRRPVCGVSWQDAVDFCLWLSETKPGTYRLPTEAEWEYACRAGTTTPYSTGMTLTPRQANTLAEGTPRHTVNVASFPPNAWGLFDMHGNVWEWCQDAYVDRYEGAPADGSARRNLWPDRRVTFRSIRGGCWYTGAPTTRSAFRHWALPDTDHQPSRGGDTFRTYGFRVALTFDEDAQTLPEDWHDGRTILPIDPPLFIEDVTGLPEEMTNDLGMRLRLIPAGSFQMGRGISASAPREESPAHEVTVGAFYMGVHEVTVDQYRHFLEATDHPSPGDFRRRDAWALQCEFPNHPITHLTWDDAVACCEWLTETLPGTYRLPSEAQWEYAHRAGTTTFYHTGPQLPPGSANIERGVRPNGEPLDLTDGPMDVGSFAPNPWGLHDTIGNVFEWCWDDFHWGYDERAPTDGSPWLDPPTCERVVRGGKWGAGAVFGANHCRHSASPQFAEHGFRVTWVPMQASHESESIASTSDSRRPVE